jgi:hypothetical protein
VVSLDTTLLYDGVDVSADAADIGCAALANLR